MAILLNCFPPCSTDLPDLGLSVLKEYLKSQDINCDIFYWNIILKSIRDELIMKHENDDMVGILLPYIYKLYPEQLENIIYSMQIRNPLWNSFGKEYYCEKISDITKNINNIIDRQIKKYDLSNKYKLIGISYRFSQWIPALIFVDKIKRLNPNVKFVMGAIGTRIEAIKILESLNGIIDYAIWGEGEKPLTELVQYINLSNNEYPTHIQSLVYKDARGKYTYNDIPIQYTEMVIPDFGDFFKFFKSERSNIYLPIERSRGCSWRKCKFCYLNEGYKYRCKTNDELIYSIEYLSKKYKIKTFCFHDNDLIGTDQNNIEELLDLLSLLVKKHNITFRNAEINSYYLNKNIAEKFSHANFKGFQIGFESMSENRLYQIRKQANFINHLLAIKLCNKYRIMIMGANIIKGFPDELVDDIRTSTSNLHYLRFFLNPLFQLNVISLNIKYTSQYFKNIAPNELYKWYSEFEDLIKDDKIKQNSYYLFEHFNTQINSLWDQFSKNYYFYLRNEYKYALVYREMTNDYLYSEYFNDNELLDIKLDEIDFEILKKCNWTILDIDELRLTTYINGKRISKHKFGNIIKRLSRDYLIYKSEKENKILSIIDTDIL